MPENPVLIYGLFFIACLAFSLIINSFLLKFAKTLGIRNTSETIIRWSGTSKPSLGGISFFIIFLFSLIFVSFLFADDGNFFNLRTLGILLAVTVGFLLGLFDDAYNTRPLIKVFTQMICGVILIITGSYIQLFDSNLFNYALTLFWVVGMMNSINMLDNMDGITAVVSLGILVAILLGMFLGGGFENPLFIIVLATIASLIGFLHFNWHPSRMFMGDTGSQFLGILLAAFGINCLWNGMSFQTDVPALMRFFAVITLFALPIIDTTTVSFKRILRGSSPFVGGKDHTTHHLSYLGLNDRQVGWVFVGLSVVSIMLTLFLTNFISTWKMWHNFLYGGYFVGLLTVLFMIANMNKEKEKI
ncbi:MAG: undecaprenyl/decaprenyl-phosphate alpha-N-acetylglucosaminyl 1-phosphate transferase [Bacteroidetes bacterium]|nr:MAG: undecaprenyl/decaprenyl-phosphate alpha-N-acetylglucosaminyl 1-phosphate transferase [Bacteroidota bacterium]